MTILVKIHDNGKSKLIAVCDSECIGKIYSEGDLRIDIKDGFYGGDSIDEVNFDSVFEGEVSSINVFGKDSIDFFEKKCLINEDEIKEIQGIPFAIIIMM